MKENRSQLIRKFDVVIKPNSLTSAEKERLAEVESQPAAIREHEPCPDFREELFIKVVRLGKINYDGWMEYELKCVVVWMVRVWRYGDS